MKRFITTQKMLYNDKFKYLNDVDINDNTTFKLPIVINAAYILKIYNINTIEDLNTYVVNNNESKYIISDIINAWCLDNIKILKENKVFISNLIFNSFVFHDEMTDLMKQGQLDIINNNIDKYLSLPDVTSVNFYIMCTNGL